jgi:hypothetical protein
MKGEDEEKLQHGHVLGILVGQTGVGNQTKWAHSGFQISIVHRVSRNYVAY